MRKRENGQFFKKIPINVFQRDISLNLEKNMFHRQNIPVDLSISVKYIKAKDICNNLLGEIV